MISDDMSMVWITPVTTPASRWRRWQRPAYHSHLTVCRPTTDCFLAFTGGVLNLVFVLYRMYLSPLLLLFSLGANATGFLKAKGLGEFDALLRSNDFVLALFGSKWCGNICAMAARAVRDAARMLPPDLTSMYEGTDLDDLDALDEPDNPLVLLRVDGSQKVNEGVLQQEGVDEYPAIHFYVRGYKHVFNLNFRTPEFIHPWLIFT
ncbi:hypothetical protein FOZ63_001630, partial [Perkinsus olseni]